MKGWPEWAKAGAQGTTGLLEQAHSYLVFAPEDSKSQKQKFFSKRQFIWSINQNVNYLKNTCTPMIMGMQKESLKKWIYVQQIHLVYTWS